MPIPGFLLYAIGLAVYLKYLIIFFATTFGGIILMLACGFLIREGVFDIIPIFLVLSLGELTWDACWYAVGHFYADAFIARWGTYFSFTPELFEKVKVILAKYHGITLFMNKILMGLGVGIPVLMTAAASGVPFWRYMFWNAVGEIVWVSAALYIGYAYAGLYAHVAFGARVVMLVGTLGLIAILGYGVALRIRKRALDELTR